jgi:tetratricopeptide (TPR) repeat protein
VDLSLDLLKGLTEKYSGYDFRYDTVTREDMDFMAQAFSSCLNKHKNEEILFLIDDLLSPFRYYYDFEEIIPDSLLNLALASKSYNTIFRAFAAYKHSQIKIPEKIQSFFDSVRAEADKHEDRNLLASYCFLFDKPAYELILKDLPMTSRNYMVFSESKSHYRKTVDYLLGEKKIEEAAALCRSQKDFGHAARIYEKERDFKSAGRDYREAKLYQDALRCYRKVNDYPNVARVYERMKDFENAMKVWFDLGKTREVNRVRKKMETAKQKASQDSLF